MQLLSSRFFVSSASSIMRGNDRTEGQGSSRDLQQPPTPGDNLAEEEEELPVYSLADGGLRTESASLELVWTV